MLSVKGLDYSYGSKDVLKDISFDAAPNKVISILGPNGVGKTTLMKCMCGIHRPDRGSIEVDGTPIDGFQPKELAQHVAYVPQHPLTSRTTVFDTILLGRNPYIEWSVTKTDTDMVWETICSMGLNDLALKYTEEISGGELQMVHIARALVQEPDVLLLDEPTSSLDIANSHMIMHKVLDTVRNKDLCTVMTMHDINLAINVSDEFIFMKNGRIEAMGGLEVINRDIIEKVYGIEVAMTELNGKPFVLPIF